MSKVLYIEASPLKSRSHSIKVAEAFLAAYGAARPEDEIERLDLWQVTLPPFDATTIEAKFSVLRRNQASAEQLSRWAAVREVARHFNAADKYVLSVPMWNFSVPYVLKHYIDIVTLPGENWSWSRETGYQALLTGKKALTIYASANMHEDTGPAADDFQKPLIRRWLRFIGVEDVQEITVAPTLTDPATIDQLQVTALDAATRLARHF